MARHERAAPLVGADDCGGLALIEGLHCTSGGISDSDALLVRFAGRSRQPDGLQADGSVVDCSGYGVPERAKGDGDHPSPASCWFTSGARRTVSPN